jgi:drug/metabolite transporter (DMT)-like permease/RimJ/RimL family protein N-acetyltransferase
MTFATLALVAFAANSILCRIALRQDAIDPATFTTIRLVSGAATLLLVTPQAQRQSLRGSHSWISAALLALYAIPFSFAYLGLSAGTGALILFGSVQATMWIAALRSGERPHPMQWIGLALALAGLVYLTLPGLSAPPLLEAILMTVAGVAWGMYSLRGKGSANPIVQTRNNFVLAVPFVFLVSVASLSRFHMEPRGIWLALASGVVASGLGYVAWYAALRGISASRAAILQLAVPILAAIGGVLILAESISPRLIVSTIAILGGIAMAIMRREKSRRAEELRLTDHKQKTMLALPPIPPSDGLVLQTVRLDLQPITREHAPNLFGVLSDPRIHEFTGSAPPADLASLTRLYEYWEKRISPDGSEYWLNWAVRLRATGEWIGHVQASVQPGSASLAWVLGSAWQGQGYATEAARAVVDWLLQFGVREIRASIHPEHAASIKVAERLGLLRTASVSAAEVIWKRTYTGPSSAA